MKSKMSDRYKLLVKFVGSSVSVTIVNVDTGACQVEIIPIIGNSEEFPAKEEVQTDEDVVNPSESEEEGGNQ